MVRRVELRNKMEKSLIRMMFSGVVVGLGVAFAIGESIQKSISNLLLTPARYGDCYKTAEEAPW